MIMQSSTHIQPNELHMKSLLSFPSQSSGAISVLIWILSVDVKQCGS